MLKPEEFSEIVTAVSNDTPITQEQAAKLVATVQRMDLQLLIGQNALHLAVENMAVTVPALAQAVMERCGRTDKKIKKKIAEMAGAAVGDFEISLQSYLANAMFEAARLLGVSIEDFIGEAVAEAEEPAGAEAATEEGAQA